jgi:L-alanine-DL-glutamate epimerase-like enolase superfamily enzyme
MRIRRAEAILIDLPPLTVREDAIQAFVKQETILVDLETEEGLTGTGYAYTVGTGGRAILALLRHDLLDRLIGEDARECERLWRDLLFATHATAVGAITSLALAAIDIALWDLRGKALGQPLWLMAGGARSTVPLYDTEGGWLNLSIEQLLAGAQAAVANGMGGVKMKVGKPDPHEDLERARAVREAIGPSIDLMLDANQAFSMADARRRARLLEQVDPFWLEEPLPADDLSGHRQLSSSTSVPIAVGESIYSLRQFSAYLACEGAAILQPDVGRIGGITPWLKVAHLAEAFNVNIAPHFLMELHVSLACAVPNALYIEHIPQLQPICHSSLELVDGYAIAPSTPGVGIDWNRDAIEALAEVTAGTR